MMKCEICGKSIGKERLKAMPDTKFCVKCSEDHSPEVVHDPNEICAKASVSSQNGFAPND